MSDRQPGASERPKFLCDAMLGSLARWLRFFGFDAAYLEPGVEDLELAELARGEGRWLLTRDHELASLGPRTMLVRAEALEDQLVEVLSRLGLEPEPNLESSRCGECNGRLEAVTRDEVRGAVPPYVLANAPRFRRCTSCGRIYWPATHTGRILEKMEGIVGRLENPG
jgi:uncharacterized protein with PIN domain